MARSEHDREDLLAEATGLSRRAEVRVRGCDEPWVIGFRKSGELSLYFQPDEVFHFNAEGALRRAFVEGHLIKADGGRLVELTRCRTPDVVELRARPFSVDDEARFAKRLAAWLERMRGAIDHRLLEVVRQVPADWNPVVEIAQWLTRHGERLRVAQTARVG